MRALLILLVLSACVPSGRQPEIPTPASLPDSAFKCPATKTRPAPPPKPRTLDQVVAWATATADVADYNERVGTTCRGKLIEAGENR